MARMNDFERLAQKKKKISVMKKIFVTFACLVVFITTYMLILPALTLETELDCNIEEHSHGDSCYSTSKELTCNKEEKEGHEHSSSCYDEEGNLICDKEECEGHKHSDSCYKEKKELTCKKEEHTHSDGCYKKKEEATTTEAVEETTTQVEALAAEVTTAETTSTEEAKEENENDPKNFELTAKTEDEADHAVVTIKGEYKTFDAEPENISLSIKNVNNESADQLTTEKYGEEAANIAGIYHYDIRIKDKDEAINPKDKISVKLEGIELGTDKAKLAIYTLKDGESELDKVDFTLKDNGDIEFESKNFKDYEYEIVAFNAVEETTEEIMEETTEAIVEEEVKTATEFTYEDGDIKVVATLSEEAQMPETAEFKVSKLAEGSEEYKASEKKIQAYAEKNNLTIIGHVPYDMHFEVEGQEVEPEGKVNISVTYKKSVEIKSDNDNAEIMGADEDYTILHLKEDGKKVTVEDLDPQINVSKDEKVKAASFETDSFSTFELTKFSGNDWITPGTSESFAGVLGDARYYGIVANEINKGAHMDSTIATKVLTSSGNITTGVYINNSYGGACWIGSIDGTLKIDGSGTTCYCPSDVQPKVELSGTSTTFVNKTQAQVNTYVGSMISHIASVGSEMAGQPSGTTSDQNLFNNSGKKLDFSQLPGGTYYLDGDCFSKFDDMTIIINDNQNVVFNFTSTTVRLKRFNIKVGDRAQQQTATSDASIEPAAKRVFFNMPNATDLYIDSAIAGVVMAPNATLHGLGGTSSGWLIVDKLDNNGSEWHFVYQDMVPIPVGFNAIKTVDGNAPTADQKFTFTLSELVNGSWAQVEQVQNDGSNIHFSEIEYDENSVGTHWYLMKEEVTSSLSSQYNFSTDLYIEKVVISVSNDETALLKTVTKYKVKDAYKDNFLITEGGKTTVNPDAIESYSDDITFANTTKREDKTFIDMKKVWANVAATDTPDSITFGVYNGDTQVTTFVLKKDSVTGGTDTIQATLTGEWAAKVTGLPILTSGTYSVKELFIGENPGTAVTVKEDGTVVAGAYKVTYSTEGGVLVITNTKYSDYSLPHTGGMGTKPFTMAGLILVLFAIGMMILQRKDKRLWVK